MTENEARIGGRLSQPEGERQSQEGPGTGNETCPYRGFPTFSGAQPGRVQGATTEYVSTKRGPTGPLFACAGLTPIAARPLGGPVWDRGWRPARQPGLDAPEEPELQLRPLQVAQP